MSRRENPIMTGNFNAGRKTARRTHLPFMGEFRIPAMPPYRAAARECGRGHPDTRSNASSMKISPVISPKLVRPMYS